MKRFIYMNERVRQAKPRGPVIVCQNEVGETMESNGFELRFDGFKIGRVVFDPAGLRACKTHDVKAWVEIAENVEVIPDPVAVEPQPLPFQQKPIIPLEKQAASAKRPNQKVKF